MSMITFHWYYLKCNQDITLWRPITIGIRLKVKFKMLKQRKYNLADAFIRFTFTTNMMRHKSLSVSFMERHIMEA